MKGSGVSALVTLIIVLSAVIFINLLITYYYSTITRASSEIEKISEGECYRRASIAIIGYRGNISTEKNLTIKNTGGIALNLKDFRVYFSGKKINYSYTGDEILEIGEETILKLPKDIGLGEIKVIGRCGAMDEIDTRYMLICHDGYVSFAEECESLGDCDLEEFPYGNCTANKKCEECYCVGTLDCTGSLIGCAIGSEEYCKYCVGDVNYCNNCAHCGDGICNCGENSVTCYRDCS